MSNNDLDNDDFDNDDFGGFDDEKEESGTLGELIQSNPMIKVGIVLGVVALIFGMIILFGGKEEATVMSSVGAAPDMTAAPGTEEASIAYIEAIQDVNQQNLERAEQSGDSAIPIPIEPPQGRLEATQEEEETEDPLQRWRRLQEERLQREMERREVIEPAATAEDNGRAEAINAMAQAMSTQMQSVLERQGTYIIDQRTISEKVDEEEGEGTGENGEATDGEEAEIPQIVIVPAGEIEYAQLITEANSDVDGPILGEIVSGPLAGSRILGEFAVEEELLSLRFNTVVVDGVSYPIQTIALDPATTLTAMATDVDHRYFQRIVLPTAAAFVEGAASIIADSGRTEVSVSGDVVVEDTRDADVREEIAGGVEEAGARLSEVLEEMNDDVEPLIIVRSGTPMGLLFLEPMTRPADINDF